MALELPGQVGLVVEATGSRGLGDRMPGAQQRLGAQDAQLHLVAVGIEVSKTADWESAQKRS